jgi:sulfoxide reductase heme-binding subunit YedZ
MSVTYRAVDWNRQKRVYDLTLAALLVGGLGLFVGLSLVVSPLLTAETLILRSTAVGAAALLQVILCIGPAARLDPRFLPFLYNRRHLGVTLFGLALVHAVLAVIQFHALGDENPLVSVFTAYRRDYVVIRDGVVEISHLPFEPFGAVALVGLFLLAATSHDFWLRNLGPLLWKSLHLGVYAVYGLVLAHVAFGVLQSERSPLYPLVWALGLVVVAGLHVAAARRESRTDQQPVQAVETGWEDVGSMAEPVEGRGRVVTVGGQRLALFRRDGRLFATSNVCRHQGGPLGEGRIVDGCITCPWHGWNYRPEDGVSPPPFQERVTTHEVRVVAGRVRVRVEALPLGTPSLGALVEEGA